MAQIWILVLMFVIFYFVLIRPQRKKQKELEAKIAALKSGDRIISAGGIHGMVARVKDRTVIVKVADNLKLEFEKSSITTTFPKGDGKADDAVEVEVEEEEVDSSSSKGGKKK